MRQLDREVIVRLHDWGIKDKKSGIDARIIFYGPPGTGKTLLAMQAAIKALKEREIEKIILNKL